MWALRIDERKYSCPACYLLWSTLVKRLIFIIDRGPREEQESRKDASRGLKVGRAQSPLVVSETIEGKSGVRRWKMEGGWWLVILATMGLTPPSIHESIHVFKAPVRLSHHSGTVSVEQRIHTGAAALGATNES